MVSMDSQQSDAQANRKVQKLTTEPGSPVPGPSMSSSVATTPPPLAASLLPKLEGLTTGQDPALQMAYVVSALLILTWLCGSGRETTSESTGRRRLNRELGHTRLLDVIVSEAHPNVMQRDDDDGENRYVASNSFAASGSTGDLDAFAVHAAAASQPNACETGPRSVHHCGQPNSRLPGRPVPSTVPHPAQSASRAKPQSSQPSACTPANVLHVSPVSCHSLLATTLQPQAVPTTKHEPTSKASPMNVHHASRPPFLHSIVPTCVSPASTPTPFASSSDDDRCLPQHRMYHRIYAASQASPPAKARLPFAIGMGIHSLPTPTPLPPPAPLSSCSSCSSCSPLLPLPSKSTSEQWVSPPLDPSMSATQMSDIVARRRLQPGPATTRLWRVPPAESPIVRAYASTLVDGIKMRQTSWW